VPLTRTTPSGSRINGGRRRTVVARRPLRSSSRHATVSVKSIMPRPPEYHPGVAHNHTPCLRWDLIRKNPNSAFFVDRAVDVSPKPFDLVNWAVVEEFGDKPIGRLHLNWYLFAGRGKDYVENDGSASHYAKRLASGAA